MNDMPVVYFRLKKILPLEKCHLWYVHSLKSQGFLFYRGRYFYFFQLQVKMGTERGSVVVKGAVLTLYSILFALGLCRALPLTCIVSKS